MSYPFEGGSGLVLVEVRVEGPVGQAYLVLALDTGATSTLINVERLVSLGYDPAASPDRTRITTVSGMEYVAVVPVSRLSALGEEVVSFPIVAHTLPPSAGIDGLLGLDFLRNSQLTVDFVNGLITLSPRNVD